MFRHSFLILPILFIVGCAGPEHAEVEGKVTLKGAPLANIKVVFMAEYTQGTKAPYTFAFTDADGRFRLRTVKGKDGAVVGYYRVVLQDIQSKPGVPSRLPRQYETANETPLKNVQVQSGTQSLNFELVPARFLR